MQLHFQAIRNANKKLYQANAADETSYIRTNQKCILNEVFSLINTVSKLKKSESILLGRTS